MKRPRRILHQKIDLDTGIVLSEVYWQNRRKHRDPREGPAVTCRDAKTGTTTLEDYLNDGQFDRPDGPASIERDAKTGVVTTESYYEHGRLHRTDGPAIVLRDTATGNVFHESYYQMGMRHRPLREGPALIDRVDGQVAREEYWVNGIKVTGPRRPDDRDAVEHPENRRPDSMPH